MGKSIGRHALIESYGGISHLGEAELKALMVDAAEAAGATILGSDFHLFGEGFGVTGVLILAESHITVHTWPEFDYAAFDVFMCGDCNPEKAAAVIADHYQCLRSDIQVVSRGGSNKSLVTLPEIASKAEALCDSEPLLITRLIDNGIASSGNEARKGVLETLKFLYLCAHYQGVLTPSLEIDKYWHELILFTRTYRSLCDDWFGKFIDHQPTASPDSERTQYERTVQLYLSLFGTGDPNFWSSRGVCKSGCTACTN